MNDVRGMVGAIALALTAVAAAQPAPYAEAGRMAGVPSHETHESTAAPVAAVVPADDGAARRAKSGEDWSGDLPSPGRTTALLILAGIGLLGLRAIRNRD